MRLIYIPIWLDLLSVFMLAQKYSKLHLHSNMVRFIMCYKQQTTQMKKNLHSNMVRFIIQYGLLLNN